jgi:hypothetical protein
MPGQTPECWRRMGSLRDRKNAGSDDLMVIRRGVGASDLPEEFSLTPEVLDMSTVWVMLELVNMNN